MGSSLFGAASNFSATSMVSSSGARSSGTLAVSSPRFTYGPYLPGFTTISTPAGSWPMGNVLISAASISSRFSATSCFRPGSASSSPPK